jgi:predicted amidohydrolase YtcJ
MYVMVTRKDPNGTVYGQKEAISREEALRLYTTSPAHYTFEEGSRARSSRASWPTWSCSPPMLSVPAESIKDITALTTIAGGKVVYQR